MMSQPIHPRPAPSLVRIRQAPRWWRKVRYHTAHTYRRIIMLDDTPERIARGCAAGLFAALLPILGQTFVGMLLARLVNGNVLASIPMSWISNPLTTLPLWYAGFLCGQALIPGPSPSLDMHDAVALIQSWWNEGPPPVDASSNNQVFFMLGALWLGTSLIGLVLALIGLLVIPSLVRAYHQRLLMRRSAHRYR